MRRPSILLALIAAVAVVGGASGRRCDAQCSVGALQRFAPPGAPGGYGPLGKFKAGYQTDFDLFSYQGARKLLMMENYGYTIYDLSNPAAPGSPAFCDIESYSGYTRLGDAFSTVFSVGASADGTRIQVGYEARHGNLLMGRGFSGPPNCTFNFAGEFPAARSGSEAVVPYATGSGTRTIGFGLSATAGGMTTADVSTFVSGAPSQLPGSIPYEPVGGSPSGSQTIVAGSYLVYKATSQVVVVDIATPGPVGAIAAGFHVHGFPAASFGFPPGDQIAGVAAAIHPTNGNLYLLVEATAAVSSQQVPDGLALATYAGGVVTPVGTRFVQPAPYFGANAMAPGADAAIPTGNDILFFSWGHASSPSLNKLFTFSASSWGTDLTPGVVYDPANYPPSCATVPTTCEFQGPAKTRGFFAGSGLSYLYVATSRAAYALPVSCASATATGLYTIPPCRLLDTRNAAGPDAAAPVPAAGEDRLFSLLGRCGLPATAKALSVNITTTGSTADGSFTLYASDLGVRPISDQLPFRAGTTRAVNAVIGLPQDGSLGVRAYNASTGPAHLILDVNGYFQ